MLSRKGFGCSLGKCFVKASQGDFCASNQNQSRKSVKYQSAFEVNRLEWVAEKNVLLVDDVFTTRATVNEMAKTLKKAGAEKVYIYTLGRVVVGKGLDR